VGDLSAVFRELPAVVFVNPHAGAGRAGRFLPAVREVFASHKIPVEFLLTESVENLESLALGAIQDGRRLLFAMGGDGTFQGLVNAAFGSDVLLGILPAGGGNDFASALGLPRDPIAATHSVLRGREGVVDLLRARCGEGRQRLYTGGGGIGVDADAANHAAVTYPRLRGRVRYIAGLTRALREFKGLRVRAEFPSSSLAAMEANVFVAAAFNTPSYGSGVRLVPNALLDDGLLDVAFVESMSAWRLPPLLAPLLLRGTLPDARVKRVRARCVVLSADRPCIFHGDGEIFGPAPVRIEVVPRAIRIVAPLAT
jgi:diacylglycerol kinase (ATP)